MAGERRRLVWETYGDLGITRSREVTTLEKVLAEMGVDTIARWLAGQGCVVMNHHDHVSEHGDTYDWPTDAEALEEMGAGRIWTCVERLTWTVRARGCYGHSRCGWAWVVWEEEG